MAMWCLLNGSRLQILFHAPYLLYGEKEHDKCAAQVFRISHIQPL